MAAFLVRAPLEQVQEHVLWVLECQEFSISDGAPAGATRVVTAVKPSSGWWLGIESRISLETKESTTLMTASFRPALLGRIALLVPSVAFTAIALIMSLYPDLFLGAAARVFLSLVAHVIVKVVSASDRTPLTELPTSYVILASHVVALVPLLLAQSGVVRKISGVVPKAETAFWEEMRSEFSVRLVALAKCRALGRGESAVLTTGVVTAIGLLLFAAHAYILLGALPLLVCVWVAAVLPLIGEDRPGLHARVVCAGYGFKTTLVNALVLLLPLPGLALTLEGQWEHRAGADSGFRSLSAFKAYLDSGGPLLDEVRTGEERMRQLRDQMNYWAGRITENKPDEEYRAFVEGALIAAVAIPLGAGLWFFLRALFLLWRSMATSLAEEWRDQVTKVDVDWIRLPATIESRALRSITFRLGLGVFFVAGSVMNVLALLVAVDSYFFALFDHVLLFWWLQPLLTWVFVPFEAFGLLTGTAGSAVWDAAARAIIMAITAPPLIMCGRRVLGGCWRTAARTASVCQHLLRRTRIPPGLKHHMVELCDEHGLPLPRLRVLMSKMVSLALVPSPVGLRPRLYVSAAALSMLTEAELKAAVAHELGHVRQGTARLRWLRLISTLGGHPPWFLLLPVDLRGLEEKADQFALRAGADPQALASAVIKAGNLGGQTIRKGAVLAAWLQTCVPDRVLRPVSGIVRSVAVVDRFLFTDYLVSSPHPAIRDRLAAILAWVPEHQTSAQASP